MTRLTSTDLDLARKVFQTEASAILALVDRLDAQFEEAVHLLVACRGRVVLAGMGKSGIICRKIASTLSSTGTPSFFLHPAEAIHGDLGAVQADDVLIVLSNSGSTDELLQIVQAVKTLGARVVALTGAPQSALSKAADITLDCSVSAEACPLGLAPTASTTAALAMGDALAMSVLVAKGFKLEDFARLHPGGGIGKRLMPVEQLMHQGKAIPCVKYRTPMPDVIDEMNRKRLGMTCVCDDGGRLLGIITDGDLRRHLSNAGLLTLTAADVMTADPRTIGREMLAEEALNVMERGPRKITAVVVVDAGRRIEGVVHIHDLLRPDLM